MELTLNFTAGNLHTPPVQPIPFQDRATISWHCAPPQSVVLPPPAAVSTDSENPQCHHHEGTGIK